MQRLSGFHWLRNLRSLLVLLRSVAPGFYKPARPGRPFYDNPWIACLLAGASRISRFRVFSLSRPLLLFAVVLGFTACKGHDKKILVYASSDIQTDNTKTNITVTDGTTHHEQELDFPGSDPVTLNAQSPQGKLALNATEDGLYIANLKNDTVIGSYQHVGSDNAGKITQDALKQKLDSLQRLLLGQNVSDANRNYFILPGKIVKITSQTQAKVFGPFTTIPGSFDAGSVPEIYKFYSIKEVREIVGNLQKMTK